LKHEAKVRLILLLDVAARWELDRLDVLDALLEQPGVTPAALEGGVEVIDVPIQIIHRREDVSVAELAHVDVLAVLAEASHDNGTRLVEAEVPAHEAGRLDLAGNGDQSLASIIEGEVGDPHLRRLLGQRLPHPGQNPLSDLELLSEVIDFLLQALHQLLVHGLLSHTATQRQFS